MSGSYTSDYEQEAALLRIKVEELEKQIQFMKDIPCTTCHEYKAQYQDLVEKFDEVKGYFPKIVQFMRKHLEKAKHQDLNEPKQQEAPPAKELGDAGDKAILPQTQLLSASLQQQIESNARYQDLQSQVIKLQQQVSSMATQLCEKEQDVLTLQTKNTILQNTIISMQQELCTASDAGGDQRRRLEDAQREVQCLQGLLQQQKAIYTQQNGDLINKIQHLTRENVTAEATVRRLTAELDFLRQK